jgi:hypothetical protein
MAAGNKKIIKAKNSLSKKALPRGCAFFFSEEIAKSREICQIAFCCPQLIPQNGKFVLLSVKAYMLF